MRHATMNDGDRADGKQPELEHNPGDVLSAQVVEAGSNNTK